MAMVAIEATIVSTAMPQIVAQLGDLHLYSWVFSSFLLTQTAMTVVFGKLADLYGRKPVMLAGIAIFLIGSVLAGFAWSMPAMIVFRLIQGVGAGAIQPVTLTIVADLYPARERGKVQGYLASVWAISAVVGPMVGGFIIHNLSWAWIFWMNVPIGLASAAGFIVFLRESERHARPSIDFGGAALFMATIAALMMALTYAGDDDLAKASLAGAAFLLCVAVLRDAGAPRGRADDLVRAMEPPPDRRMQWLDGAVRHDPDGRHHVPADVRARRAASLAGGRRPRADDDDGRLAGRRDARGEIVPSARLAAHSDRR